MHSRPDPMGGIAQEGWLACGLETSLEPQTDRTWAALGG